MANAVRHRDHMPQQKEEQIRRVRDLLGVRSLALVGMMGSGKTCAGRRLAERLGLLFRDGDWEIEMATGMTIPEIFETFGESYFRDGERRVIARLMREGPAVVATGGGAYMDERVRSSIAESAVSLWFCADLETLFTRVIRNQSRPLLKTRDPKKTLSDLIDKRYPVYALTDITVDSSDAPQEVIVSRAVDALEAFLVAEKESSKEMQPG